MLIWDAERRAQEKMKPVYEKRRAVVKAISKFWPVAMMNHAMLSMHAQHNSDQAALSYLEDLWIVRDPVESRCFTLEFVSGCLPAGPMSRVDAPRFVEWLLTGVRAGLGDAALQGEPVLFEHGAEKGVQVRAAAGRD